jgi:hypothetical protein
VSAPQRKKVSPNYVATAALNRKGPLGNKAPKEKAPPKEKWTTKPVGGSGLSWDPYGDKTLVRYATEQEHAEFEKRKRYSAVNYGGSRDKAIWFATKDGQYDAGFASDRPWRVIVEVQVNNQTPLINFEAEEFDGEAAHPDQVILKENERGAYGIGRNMIDNLRPRWEEND